jgi:hypothetical protein
MGLTARKIFLFFVYFLIMERSKHGVCYIGNSVFTLGLVGGHCITGELLFFSVGFRGACEQIDVFSSCSDGSSLEYSCETRLVGK